jgi:thiol-disulfide isomerase/thioredoxin
MSADSTSDPKAPRGSKRMLSWVERAVVAGVLVFAAIRLGPQVGALLGVSFDPEPAPQYGFVSLTGDTIRSTDLAGRVVVLNFWATWCGPCKLEMPSLQKLHERRADDGVVVLGLATDVGPQSTVRGFLEDRGITYPVGRASRAHRTAFGGIPGIPTTFLIDRNGRVRHKVVGYFAPPALNAAVARLADEVATP